MHYPPYKADNRKQMTSPPTFPLFTHLPPELGQAIFSFALAALPSRTLLISQVSGFWATSNALPVYTPTHPSPIQTTSNSNSRFTYTDGIEQYVVRWISPSVDGDGDAVTALLHVNSEVRAMALRQYTMITLDEQQRQSTYFNFERDTLVVRCHPFWGTPPPPLSFTPTLGPEAHPNYTYTPTLQSTLSQVQNLTVLSFRHRNYTLSTLSLIPFLGLTRLVVVRRREGRAGVRIERELRRTVEVFWRESMNRMQADQGFEVTEPPQIEFLGLWEVERFDVD